MLYLTHILNSMDGQYGDSLFIPVMVYSMYSSVCTTSSAIFAILTITMLLANVFWLRLRNLILFLWSS